MQSDGEIFKEYIDNKSLTDTQVGNILGCSSQQVGNYFKSKRFQRPTIKMLETAFTGFILKDIKDKILLNNTQQSIIGDNPNSNSDNNVIYDKQQFDQKSHGQANGPDADKEVNGGAIPTANNDNKGVPYYDIDFMGGFDMIFNDQQVQPSFYIDFLPFNDCDCWINVTGKSMGPLIAHGDIVGLKKVDNWKRFLLEGEIYAIITDNGFRTIKMIGAGHDKDHYTLIPYNKSEEYKPQTIPKDVITHIFRVKGNIKKFF